MDQIRKLSPREEAELLQGIREYFSYSDGAFFWKKRKGPKTQIGKEVGSSRPDGYRQTYFNQKPYLVHHLVWLFHKGAFPEKNLDHRDRDITNNRIENLRPADQWQNRGNSEPRVDRPLPMGVYLSESGKYKSSFRNKHLGTFETIEDALVSYGAARKEYYGDFAFVQHNQEIV